MRRVYSAPTSVPVDVMRSLLESEGIDCVVRNRHLGLAAGEVPPHETWPGLWVLDEENFAKAEQLVAEFLRDDPASRGQWKCPLCGERIDGRMGACWRCARPDDATGDVDELSASMREHLVALGDRARPIEQWLLATGIAVVIVLLFGWLAANQ